MFALLAPNRPGRLVCRLLLGGARRLFQFMGEGSEAAFNIGEGIAAERIYEGARRPDGGDSKDGKENVGAALCVIAHVQDVVP